MERSSDTIIIGAGLTGLSCAFHLGAGYTVLEKERRPGGLCGSERIDGFTFDRSGHFLHLHNPLTKKLINKLLAGKLSEIKRSAWIHTVDTFVPFPFQANLRYLPEKLRIECLEKFMRRPVNKKPGNFLAWSIGTYGEGITKYFMKPYNEKLWTIAADKLSTEWIAPFVPNPSPEEILRGATTGQSKDFGYNVNFLYPKLGGCQTLANAFADKVTNIKFGENADRIALEDRVVETASGQRYGFKNLVSTQPLVRLLAQMDRLPSEINALSKKLRWNSVLCINLAFKKTGLTKKLQTEKHWVYLPDKKFSAYRFGIYTNISDSMAPKGFVSMYVELSFPSGTSIDPDRSLARALEELRKAGLLEGNERPEVVNFAQIPYAYVIYDARRRETVKPIQDFLRKNGIFSIGRYGAWEYSFMESSILQGMETAELIKNHDH
jgi:protoporphyrinogen oxidase